MDSQLDTPVMGEPIVFHLDFQPFRANRGGKDHRSIVTGGAADQLGGHRDHPLNQHQGRFLGQLHRLHGDPPPLNNLEGDVVAGVFGNQFGLQIINHHVVIKGRLHHVHQLLPVKVGPYGFPLHSAFHVQHPQFPK